jgi:moderate conductance mechanosensitive channel
MVLMLLALIEAHIQKVEVWMSRAADASVYLIGAAILTVFIIWATRRFSRYTANLIRERGGRDQIEVEKQTTTIISLVRRVVLGLLWTLAVILALEKFQFDVKPLLAGAGVAGIAIGFAAQSLLKDWISGFFLITEGQIRMNDVLRIGDLSGSVEKISLRTISLRAYDGTLHVISNGSVTAFSNMTMSFSYAVFEVPADLGDDTDRMVELMQQVSESLRTDAVLGPMILEPIEIAGVDRFTEQGVLIKARIKTSPSSQWPVAREFNRRLKQAADAAGVKLATAQRQVSVVQRARAARQSPGAGADAADRAGSGSGG